MSNIKSKWKNTNKSLKLGKRSMESKKSAEILKANQNSKRFKRQKAASLKKMIKKQINLKNHQKKKI
jgi:hypothetical protein